MYPQFEIFWIQIYSFWIWLSISFVLFFWMLYKLSLKYWINSNFFLNNIFFYFISMFFFSRLFYIVSEWRSFKFVFQESLQKFFLMPDYNFSIIWWVFWFFLILFFKIKKFKLKSEKYIDAVVLAFLFAAIVWYIWAFLGWQILGKPTNLSIWITYNSVLSKSSYSWPIFPLAFIYSIISFVLFTALYITRLFTKIEWFVWYLWIIIFSSCLLIFEFFNVSIDTFSTYTTLNITQIGAVALIIYASLWLSKIYKKGVEA